MPLRRLPDHCKDCNASLVETTLLRRLKLQSRSLRSIFSKVAALLSGTASNNTHICGEGCYLFGCGTKDHVCSPECYGERVKAARTAAKAEAAATAVAYVPEAPLPADVVNTPAANTPDPVQPQTEAEKAADVPNFNRSSEAEILRWLRNQTAKQVTITPGADLEGQTLEYWKDKATVTVKRMMELYRGFSCTLSREASMQFDNFRDRHLVPMLGKVLYYEPETVKSILGDDAAILLDNSTAPEKPIIDTNTQLLTELKWRGKTWASAPLPRLTGYLGPAGDLNESKE
jgi:hypothetical protein